MFLVSQNISLFGSSVVAYAIIWHITLETASGIWMMLATMSYHIPGLIIALWGGVWADRYYRKHLIMAADAFVALATLAVAIAFWSGCKNLELLLLASAFRSLGGGVQSPAVNAVYPQLIPAEQLARVQGINQSLASLLMLISPVAGGAILGLGSLEKALMVDVLTAAAAIAILASIKIPAAKAETPDSTFKEMKEGLKYVFSHRDLRLMLACVAAFFFLAAPASILTPLMLVRSFGPELWRLAATEAAWAGAAIFGGIFVTWHGDFKDKAAAMAFSMVTFGLFSAFMGLAGNFAIYLVFVALAGFVMPIYMTAETVFIQQTTDPAKLGRVFSISQVLYLGLMPGAIALFGPLAEVVSVEMLLLVCGLLLVLVGFLYFKASRFECKAD